MTAIQHQNLKSFKYAIILYFTPWLPETNSLLALKRLNNYNK